MLHALSRRSLPCNVSPVSWTVVLHVSLHGVPHSAPTYPWSHSVFLSLFLFVSWNLCAAETKIHSICQQQGLLQLGYESDLWCRTRSLMQVCVLYWCMEALLRLWVTPQCQSYRRKHPKAHCTCHCKLARQISRNGSPVPWALCIPCDHGTP